MKTTLGLRLKELRTEKELTQKQLAEKLNINSVTYLHYEKEQREPPLSLLADMAEFFGVTVDYLLGLTDWKHKIKTAVKRFKNKKTESPRANFSHGGFISYLILSHLRLPIAALGHGILLSFQFLFRKSVNFFLPKILRHMRQ